MKGKSVSTWSSIKRAFFKNFSEFSAFSTNVMKCTKQTNRCYFKCSKLIISRLLFSPLKWPSGLQTRVLLVPLVSCFSLLFFGISALMKSFVRSDGTAVLPVDGAAALLQWGASWLLSFRRVLQPVEWRLLSFHPTEDKELMIKSSSRSIKKEKNDGKG